MSLDFDTTNKMVWGQAYVSFVWRTSAHALATQMSHTPRSVPPLRSARHYKNWEGRTEPNWGGRASNFIKFLGGGVKVGQCKLPGTARELVLFWAHLSPPKKEPGRVSRSVQDISCMARLVDFWCRLFLYSFRALGGNHLWQNFFCKMQQDTSSHCIWFPGHSPFMPQSSLTPQNFWKNACAPGAAFLRLWALSVSVCACILVYLCVRLCMFVWVCQWPSVCLCLSLSVCLSVCLSEPCSRYGNFTGHSPPGDQTHRPFGSFLIEFDRFWLIWVDLDRFRSILVNFDRREKLPGMEMVVAKWSKESGEKAKELTLKR